MATKSKELGVIVKDFRVDMKLIKKRKDQIVLKARTGNQKGIEATKNLELIFGDATFTSKKTVSVKLKKGETVELKADLIFLNTGCKTIVPEIDGLDEID